MIKYITFVMIVAARIVYNPSPASPATIPFAAPSLPPVSHILSGPAKLVTINGSVQNNKVILNWVVEENETADQFEVEKSADGKNFSLAALVFATDEINTGNYQFYEKAGKRKMVYRIKLINKNRQTTYSPVVEINPNS
jgi:hypothetical protein